MRPEIPRPWRTQILWCLLTLCVLASLSVRLRQTFLEVHTTCTQNICIGAQPTQVQMHLLRSLGVPLDAYGIYAAVVIAIFACVYGATAAVIIWSKPADRMAVVTGFTLVVFGGLTFDSNASAPAGVSMAVWLPGDILALLGGYGSFGLMLIFPNGRPAVRWPALLVLPLTTLLTEQVLARDLKLALPDAPIPLQGACWLLAFSALIYAQVYRYRYVSNPIERQQTKWVVYGIAISLAANFGIYSLYPLASMTGSAALSLLAYPATHVVGLVFPLSIGVAMLRYRLWDVDVLINRTLVYGLLTACLGVLYVGGVVLLQALFRALTGQGSGLAVAISTLAIAALFQPFRRRIQSFIDRRFYRRKYDAVRTLASLGTRLRDDIDLDQVSAEIVTVVQDTMQPTHVSLWLR